MVRKRETIQWTAVVWMKMPCWGQKRMDRLVRDDRKETVTQITTCYNQGMQKTISEDTTHRTLKQMDYSGRRPHQVLLMSAKNRTRRIQFTQDHQNWTIEDWKNVAWSDESQFLLRHSDGRVRIWRKVHESMDPSCLVSTVQAGGGVMVWGIFSWYPLVPIEHRFNATASLSIVAEHVHPFMTTVYPSSDATSSRIMHMSQSSNHLRLVSWTWQWVLFTQIASTVTRSQSNRAPLGCGGTGDSHHGCADDKSAATVWCYHVNMDQNLEGMFPKPCWIYCHEELRQFWRQKGVQPGTSVPNKVASECVCVCVCIYIYIYIYLIYIYIYRYIKYITVIFQQFHKSFFFELSSWTLFQLCSSNLGHDGQRFCNTHYTHFFHTHNWNLLQFLDCISLRNVIFSCFYSACFMLIFWKCCVGMIWTSWNVLVLISPLHSPALVFVFLTLAVFCSLYPFNSL